MKTRLRWPPGSSAKSKLGVRLPSFPDSRPSLQASLLCLRRRIFPETSPVLYSICIGWLTSNAGPMLSRHVKVFVPEFTPLYQPVFVVKIRERNGRNQQERILQGSFPVDAFCDRVDRLHLVPRLEGGTVCETFTTDPGTNPATLLTMELSRSAGWAPTALAVTPFAVVLRARQPQILPSRARWNSIHP